MRHEFFDAGEGPLGQDREPDFDLIEPGGVGQRVMEMDVLMPLQPHVALGVGEPPFAETTPNDSFWRHTRRSGTFDISPTEQVHAVAQTTCSGRVTFDKRRIL